MTYATASIAALADAGGWSAIRRELGVRAFGINAWTAQEAGTPVIPEHDERPSGHEELYLVTAGRATFTLGGEELDAPAGTLVLVSDPALRRGAVACEPATTVLAVGGRPGEPYRPRAWEVSAQAGPLLDQGRPAEARGLLAAALGRYEDEGSVLYNLACAEALLGERDAALDHLAAALREQPELAAHAREDGDLAALRGEPRFAAIVDGAATG